MRVDARLSLGEFVSILREAVAAKFPGCEVGHITIESYDQPKIEIDRSDKVTTVEFSHRVSARDEAAPARSSRSAPPGSALARARMRAYAAFDPIWRDGHMTRSSAYAWLAKALRVSKMNCHMIKFDIAMCERVVEVSTSKLEELRNELR